MKEKYASKLNNSIINLRRVYYSHGGGGDKEITRDDVLNENVEMCGYVKESMVDHPDNKYFKIGNFSFIITRKGSVDDSGRSLCQFHKEDYRKGFIWHSHPYTTKFYPSAEDIIKVLKNIKVKRSYIITPFGYWIIEFEGMIPIHDEDQRKELINFINDINNELYSRTYGLVNEECSVNQDVIDGRVDYTVCRNKKLMEMLDYLNTQIEIYKQFLVDMLGKEFIPCIFRFNFNISFEQYRQ